MTCENNLMVIKAYIKDWSVKRVLIDPGSSTDILYWDAFKDMGTDASEMLPFKGTLVVFAGKHIQVLDHMPVMTMFGSRLNAKSVKVRYLIVNMAYPYNIFIRRPAFNALKYALSMIYLTMKYLLSSREISMVKVWPASVINIASN